VTEVSGTPDESDVQSRVDSQTVSGNPACRGDAVNVGEGVITNVAEGFSPSVTTVIGDEDVS